MKIENKRRLIIILFIMFIKVLLIYTIINKQMDLPTRILCLTFESALIVMSIITYPKN